MKLLIAAFVLLSPLLGQPVIGGVVNGASFSPAVSPGCLISIFGAGLSPNLIGAATVPLPTQLGTTFVKIGGLDAPLYFVSPNQINAQVPFELLPGNAQVVVNTGQNASAAFTITLTSTSPGLFTLGSSGSGAAVYYDPGFQTFDPPLIPGNTITMYATGLGQTNPPGVTGAGGAISQVVNAPDVYLGERKAEVSYAGLAPGLAGVYQLNVVVPTALGSTRMVLISGGRQSNFVETGGIPLGNNATNVRWTLAPLYPTLSPTPKLTFSPLLIAARFTVDFELAPGAQTFTIAAVSDAGSAVIVVDPAAQTLDFTMTEPTSQTRAFNFAGTEIIPVDLTSGLPFPGRVIPISRTDPAAIAALGSLPLPNTGGPLLSTEIFHETDSFYASKTLDKNVASGFGGWLAKLPGTHYTPVRLFIDGNLVEFLIIPFNVGNN